MARKTKAELAAAKTRRAEAKAEAELLVSLGEVRSPDAVYCPSCNSVCRAALSLGSLQGTGTYEGGLAELKGNATSSIYDVRAGKCGCKAALLWHVQHAAAEGDEPVWQLVVICQIEDGSAVPTSGAA